MTQLSIDPRDFSTQSDSCKTATFRADVLRGLSEPQKTLPSKYFYDARGSDLFEAICDAPEYYVARSETALLQAIAPELASAIQPGATLVEFGSGSSTKTRILLDGATQIVGYVPIDISEAALFAAAAGISTAYPHITVTPLVADFTRPTALPAALRWAPLVGFFPGSTLGNFAPEAAVALLHSMRIQLGPNGRLIVGVDVIKEESLMVPAYDDAARVTAAFNLNLLDRINRELSADIDVEAFRHQARWNPFDRRMEMHLVSRADQTICVGGTTVEFKAGETIHTESSYKFSHVRLEALVRQAGWRMTLWWTSDAPEVAIAMLEPRRGDFAEH